MKKLVSVILIFFLTLEVYSVAIADKFDISSLRNNEYLKIDVDKDNDVAFVESTFSAKDLSFTHQYESLTQYSYSRFDLLIMNYFETDAYPVHRLWLNVCTEDDFYYFTSVTITIDEKNYTFSDVADKEWFYEKDNSHKQQLLIKLGTSNIDFLIALESFINNLDGYENIKGAKIPVTFHGSKDIKGELGMGFLLEFILFKSAIIDCNGFDYFNKTYATDMKISDS